MTVCLAGIYDHGKGALIVADKMRKADNPRLKGKSFTVENKDITKIVKLSNYVHIATAGNADFGETLIKELHTVVLPQDKTSKVIEKITEIYRRHRLIDVERKVLLHYGFNSMAEYNSTELPSSRRADIDLQIKQHVCSFDMIIMGAVDDKYSIYTLSDPGFIQEDHYGFSIVGSGVPYASELLIKKYTKAITKVALKKLFLAAKKLAEQDEYVGSMTDIQELPEVL